VDVPFAARSPKNGSTAFKAVQLGITIILTITIIIVMDGVESPSDARRDAILSALITNLVAGDIEANRALIEADPDIVKGRDCKGDYLLHWLCRHSVAVTLTATADSVACIAAEWPQALQERDADGLFPLHVAVACAPSNLPLIRAVVAARPEALLDRTATSNGGDLPLHLAIQGGGASRDVLRFLVAEGPQALRVRDASTGSLPLHRAADLLTLRKVEVLADAWPRALQETDCRGRLPLHCAADQGLRTPFFHFDEDPLIVEYLVGRWRQALWKRDEDGWLPLHVACASGMARVVDMLVRLGPRALQCKTRVERWVPLHILARRQFSTSWVAGAAAEIAAVRVAVGRWPRALRTRDARGWLPLHHAARSSRAPLEVVRLFARSWPPSLRRTTTDTRALPLHLAAPSQDVGRVRFLADSFPPALQARNADGQLPLHCCVSHCVPSLAVARFLVTAFAGALREKDNDGRLPLHHAAASESEPVVRFLAEEWAPALLEPTNDGRLPLHIAARHSATSLAVVQLLAEAAPLALQVPANDGSLPLHVAAAAVTATAASLSEKDSVQSTAAAIEHLAIACPQTLDVSDGRGRKPVHVAALHDAPLGTIYTLVRMDPAAALRFGSDVASAGAAGPNIPCGPFEPPLEAAAEFRARGCCAGGSTPRCSIL
jgi:ankyrin repeat protein